MRYSFVFPVRSGPFLFLPLFVGGAEDDGDDVVVTGGGAEEDGAALGLAAGLLRRLGGGGGPAGASRGAKASLFCLLAYHCTECKCYN